MDFMKFSYYIASILVCNFYLRSVVYGSKSSHISAASKKKSKFKPKCTLPTIECRTSETSRYRTADGTCNNLENPWWGSAGTPLRRLVAPVYDDKTNSPRIRERSSKRGHIWSWLPGARDISSIVHQSSSPEDESANITLMFMQWGQFLDHDITMTPDDRDPRMDCCDFEGGNHTSRRRPRPSNCFPIKIPRKDSEKFKSQCMNFFRSKEHVMSQCLYGYREQMNAITAFIDASNMYGSSQMDLDELRSSKGGLLATSAGPDDEHFLLQWNNPSTAGCTSHKGEERVYCFRSGDIRANEQPGLTSMHTAFLREHNYIATELASINPNWTDEIIFEETRRIIGAYMQVITYGEYLPILLGENYMKSFDLAIGSNNSFTRYNAKTNPTILNEFATAAFRFGHSQVQDFLSRTVNRTNYGDLKMRKCFHDSSYLADTQNGGGQSFIEGLLNVTSQTVDHKISAELTEHLFEEIDATSQVRKPPLDLAALNIQRGRDHGIPSYVKVRKALGLSKVKNYDDLVDHSSTVTSLLQSAYRRGNANQIDLFPAGLSEIHEPGALVGPTFAGILARQFQSLKFGDRYYFEHNQSTGFTPDQIRAIRSIKLSKILCRNWNLVEIQPSVFIKSDDSNVSVECSSLPDLDLTLWKEN